MSMFLFLAKTYQTHKQRVWSYWGLKTMAYKINKNRKGHYAMMRTDAPSEAVQEMERLMRLNEDVMRVLTIKVDNHDEGPSAQMHKRDDRSERREQND